MSLDIQPGERHAIIGPNGAGKTTLFNLLGGQLTPTAGRIHLFGQDVTGLPPDRRTYLGLARTFQISKLFLNLTVMENAVLAVQGTDPSKRSLFRTPLSNPHIAERTHALLKQWGLWQERETQVKHLSYGSQRELELVLALASAPRLLLLDEPTAGLSPAETVEVKAMLGQLSRETTVVLIEHDIDFVFDLADRITVLHLGEMVTSGPTEEVRRDPRVHDIYLGAE
jgi:branched-chain amino acid transport system ATP-binding protein